MTEEDAAPATDLVDALKWALIAGLRVDEPNEYRRWIQVQHRDCGMCLGIPHEPRKPARTARRVERFAGRHRHHPRWWSDDRLREEL